MNKPIACVATLVLLVWGGVGLASESKIARLSPALGKPRALVASGDALYLATTSRVVRFELGGAAPEPVPLVQSQVLAGGLAVDGAELFWGNQDDGALVRGFLPALLSSSMGALKPLAKGLMGLCGAVVADKKSVYVSTCADLLAVPRGGGAARKLAAGAGPLFVGDAGFLYMFSGDRLLKVPKGGGKPKALVLGQAGALALAQDERSLYFQAGGGVHRVGKDGASLTTLAQVVTPAKGAASLAVDGAGVYYINAQGEAARAPAKGAPQPVPGGAALLALHKGALYAVSADGSVFRLGQ